MRNESWKQSKLRYLRWRYADLIPEYKNHQDDRGLYCGIYDHMVAGINSLPDEPHNFVCVAMNERINEKCRILDDIRNHFEKEKAPVV